jgi:hypothetical protein
MGLGLGCHSFLICIGAYNEGEPLLLTEEPGVGVRVGSEDDAVDRRHVQQRKQNDVAPADLQREKFTFRRHKDRLDSFGGVVLGRESTRLDIPRRHGGWYLLIAANLTNYLIVI